MDDLFSVGAWAEPGSLEFYLQDVLPDEYAIAANLTVRGRPLDAVVVGPRCLWILYARDWPGETYPARHGQWRSRQDGSPEVKHPNPAGEVRLGEEALQAFMRDEFPELHLALFHLVVLTSPEATVISDGDFEPRAVAQEGIAEAIESEGEVEDGPWLTEQDRKTVAQALRDRRLATTQRASEPFVFRGGGLLGSGKKVWTIQAAVRHMDRHSDDGVFHLHNGTLALWFSEQGAEHMADLAREVMRQPEREPHINLEQFLIGTGLVPRPRLSLRPRRVDLGHVLSGGSRGQRLRIKKGRGRGYLYGSVRTSEPWLRIDPDTFSHGRFEAVVTADTETLPISQKPWPTELLIDTNASEEPVALPARVRVVGIPSRLDRRLFRPLAGALSAGLLGAGLGWALGRWDPAPPEWFEGLSQGLVSWSMVTATVLGLFWAALGGIRGWKQPLSWPISYATGRWLVRTLIWGIALVLLATVAHWAWAQVEPGLGLNLSGTRMSTIVLAALALSILPAVLGELGSSRHAEEPIRRPRRRSLLRPLLLAGAGIALVLVLVAGLLLIGPAWRQLEMDGRMSTASTWAVEQWSGLEETVGDVMDQFFVRYYDRRAPAQPTAVPAPEAN